MASAKVKKVGNKTQKLAKGLADLGNQNIEVGHFREQGQHKDSGYTYAELMALHNNPTANGFDFPPRPVLDILFFRNRKLDDPKIRRIIERYSEVELTSAVIARMLDEIGHHLTEEGKKIFGSAALAPNSEGTIAQKGRNEPLVDTGSLKERTAYRTSKNKTIKEV